MSQDWKSWFSGFNGGIAGVIVGYPLDTTKVKLQTQDYKNPQYSSTFDCFRQTIKKDGFRGLYRGMASPMAGVGATNAIIFGVHQSVVKSTKNPDALKNHLFGGMAAGFTQSFITSPVELTKTRMQLQADTGGVKYRGAFHCLQDIVKKEGVRGFFRGQFVTIMREVPAFGAYFVSYEAMARWMSGRKTSDNASDVAILMAGGIAGCSSWIVSYPLDVIKSRMQSDGANGVSRFNGIVDCCKASYKEGGARVFFRGLTSTILRAFPTNAVVFYVAKTVGDCLVDNEETRNNLNNIMQVGDIILKGAAANAQESFIFQQTSCKLWKENHLANYLPIILKNSQKSISNLANNAEPLNHNLGDCPDSDLHKVLSAILYAPIQNAMLQRSSRRWINRRGLVTQTVDSFKSVIVSQQILCSAL